MLFNTLGIWGKLGSDFLLVSNYRGVLHTLRFVKRLSSYFKYRLMLLLFLLMERKTFATFLPSCLLNMLNMCRLKLTLKVNPAVYVNIFSIQGGPKLIIKMTIVVATCTRQNT
jgi:hypothetical protein